MCPNYHSAVGVCTLVCNSCSSQRSTAGAHTHHWDATPLQHRCTCCTMGTLRQTDPATNPNINRAVSRCCIYRLQHGMGTISIDRSVSQIISTAPSIPKGNNDTSTPTAAGTPTGAPSGTPTSPAGQNSSTGPVPRPPQADHPRPRRAISSHELASNHTSCGSHNPAS